MARILGFKLRDVGSIPPFPALRVLATATFVYTMTATASNTKTLTQLNGTRYTLNNSNTKFSPSVFNSQKHPFHILGPSAYPFLTGFFVFC